MPPSVFNLQSPIDLEYRRRLSVLFRIVEKIDRSVHGVRLVAESKTEDLTKRETYRERDDENVVIRSQRRPENRSSEGQGVRG